MMPQVLPSSANLLPIMANHLANRDNDSADHSRSLATYSKSLADLGSILADRSCSLADGGSVSSNRGRSSSNRVRVDAIKTRHGSNLISNPCSLRPGSREIRQTGHATHDAAIAIANIIASIPRGSSERRSEPLARRLPPSNR